MSLVFSNNMVKTFLLNSTENSMKEFINNNYEYFKCCDLDLLFIDIFKTHTSDEKANELGIHILFDYLISNKLYNEYFFNEIIYYSIAQGSLTKLHIIFNNISTNYIQDWMYEIAVIYGRYKIIEFLISQKLPENSPYKFTIYTETKESPQIYHNPTDEIYLSHNLTTEYVNNNILNVDNIDHLKCFDLLRPYYTLKDEELSFIKWFTIIIEDQYEPTRYQTYYPSWDILYKEFNGDLNPKNLVETFIKYGYTKGNL